MARTRGDRFIELRTADGSFRARLLAERSPVLAVQLWERLPVELTAIQDEWSGRVFRSVEPVRSLRPGARDETPPYQHPGLVLVEKDSRRIAVCYEQGRLQDGFGPLRAFPIAQVGGDLTALFAFGKLLEYRGVQRMTIARAKDQRSPLAEAPLEEGHDIEVRLGAARATARVLERSAPVATRAFLAALPIEGTATNIPLNGPLVRLRTPSDSPADETALAAGPGDVTQTVLYPGHVYYRASVPRGIRVTTRDATVMVGRGGVSAMGTIEFVPLARLTGDWTALADEAARLFREGEKRLSFRLIERRS